MDNYKIIIYNDQYLNYFTGTIYNCDVEAPIEEQPMSLLDGSRRFIPGPVKSFEICTQNSECMDNIELDPTLMKRIAMYNKEKEIQKLEEEIKIKEEKIKSLDDILQDRTKRVDILKKFVANIYEINTEDYDEDYDKDYDY